MITKSSICCFALLISASNVYAAKLAEFTTHNASVLGKWLTEANGEWMQDPQTSGLSYVDGKLYSISDASAKDHQIKRLHVIDPKTAMVTQKLGPIVLSPKIIQTSCFAAYLDTLPDYEALKAIPNKTNQWLIVTEDGTRGEKIEGKCFDKFTQNNFTHYPALLVKIELVDATLMLTGVRAIEFDPDDNMDKRGLGKNIENDGIEGLAFTRDAKLLLGVEQDANNHARVFEIAYTDELFDTVDTFIKATDSKLKLPIHMAHINPINGMDVYYPDNHSDGYLIAAARNNDQLWIIDLGKKHPPIVVDVDFYAPSDPMCQGPAVHKIRNTALEGIAVNGNTLFLINDPWRPPYVNNATCLLDKPKYEGFTPLIFELPINAAWFS